MKKKKFILLYLLLFSFFIFGCDQKQKYYIYYIVDDNQVITKPYDKGTILTEQIVSNDSTYTKDGYERDGFYFDSKYNEKIIFPYEVTEAKSFYLKWNKIENEKYNVKFYNDNILFKEFNVFPGDKITSFENPKKDNYDFIGWFDSSNSKLILIMK